MRQQDEMSVAKGGINQLAAEVKRQVQSFDDIDKQLAEIAVIVNNFVLQTLGAVSDNKDLGEVNQTLVNSLIQVKDFMATRPGEIKMAREKLEQKLDAYEQCLLVMDEVTAATKEEALKSDLEAQAELKKKE